MGLSLCREISHLMKGDIAVKSIQGEGSQFIAQISVKPGEVALQDVYDKADTQVIAGMKVLVAEDNVTNRRVVEMLLQKLKVDVTVVNDGQQLLDCMKQITPDLILMDCHMPIMDGFEATRILRQQGCTIPIFALTAGVSTEERVECESIGMDKVLTKPVTLQSLKHALVNISC